MIFARDLHKSFQRDKKSRVAALSGVSLKVDRGALVALVGPDGAGKTTLIRLITGLLAPDSGELTVLGIDARRRPEEIQARVGYMPQRFGLYEDLSVQENLDLYADLHGVPEEQRPEKYSRLMQMTALGPFVDRLAGRLSGGMKQKLGLACTLVRTPELLVLDEPTVGVDPLSREELWGIIHGLVTDEKLTVLMSTAYLDEAARCHQTIVLHEGKVLSDTPPGDIVRLANRRTFLARPSPGQAARLLQTRFMEQPGVIDAVPEGGNARVVFQTANLPADTLGEMTAVPPRFEDGFMVLLRERGGGVSSQPAIRLEHRVERRAGEVVVRVRDLVRRFGNFVAVDHVSFEVRRGEIFGLLGPNGAGKTTTFRMLCGLLPSTSGTLEIAGMDLRAARDSARQRLGYVAQKFSLYRQLSVRENLDFFASAYGLSGEARRRRVEWAIEQFELGSMSRLPSEELPGGFKQRLAMAAALLHEPEILFLDEPTSGADPIARREFWRRITGLAQQGVTVIVTTHFMEEAEYCDHIVIQDAGRVLARGTPAEVRARARPLPDREPTMEDAFITIVQEGRVGSMNDAGSTASK